MAEQDIRINNAQPVGKITVDESQIRGEGGPAWPFFAYWLWWQASTPAYNVARWVLVLTLPEVLSTCRGKRLRASFFNVPERVVCTDRRIRLRLARGYRHAASSIAALKCLHALSMCA